MIGKASFGKSFGGLLKYIAGTRSATDGVVGYITEAKHDVGAIAYRNLAATTPHEVAREMTFVARRSKRVQKPVLQLIISFHESESAVLDSQRLIEVTEHVAAKLGLAKHQAAYAVHLEKPHKHCHAAINRVGPDGKAWPMWRSAIKIREACREVEREMGLVPHSVYQERADRRKFLEEDFGPAHPSRWTSKERRTYERTGIRPARVMREAAKEASRAIAAEMRPKVHTAFKRATSWEKLRSDLLKSGFDLAVYKKASRRGLQIIDAASGRHSAASKIDSAYSLLRLEKHLGPFVASELHQSTGAKASYASELSEANRTVVAEDLGSREVQDAEVRLRDLYVGQTQNSRDALATALEKNREAENATKVALSAQLRQRLKHLQQMGIYGNAMAAMRPGVVAEHRMVVERTRSEHRQQRKEIRKNSRIPDWIEFVIRLAKELVQDAITVLAWFRAHLDRKLSPNRLLPEAEAKRTPLLLDHEGLKAKVTPNGSIVYRDRKREIAFVDRGVDILLTESPEKDNVRAALEHAQRTWGFARLRGTAEFRILAINVATKCRLYLMERFIAERGLKNYLDLVKSQPTIRKCARCYYKTEDIIKDDGLWLPESVSKVNQRSPRRSNERAERSMGQNR